MIKKYLIIYFFLFAAILKVAAQGEYVFMAGTEKHFEVTVQFNSGIKNSYVWEVFDDSAFTQATQISKYTTNGSATNNALNITWSSVGTYYLRMTETNIGGCSDFTYIKVVIEPNMKILISNTSSSQCSAATLNSVQVKLSFIDDNKNPLPSTYFPISVNYTLNGVVQAAQLVSFVNQYLTIPGSTLTSNPISDTPNILVITGATDTHNLTIQSETASGQNIHTHTIFRSLTAPAVLSQTTNDVTPILSGTTTVGANETFSVSANGFTYLPGDGNLILSGTNWTLTIPAIRALSEGSYEITATVSNANCNLPDNTNNELIIDTTAPAVPTVVSQTTNDTTPIITGTATVGNGETFKVTVNGITYTSGDGKLTLTGTNWNLQIPAGSEILDGIYPVTATVTDAAGNSSTDLTNNELTISTSKGPVAVNDVFATSGPAISGNLALNDSDPDGGQLIYKTSPVTAPTKGDLVIKADGTFTYTPKLTASGTDEFIYEVCNNGSPAKCSQASVVINFNNQAPLAVNDNYIGEQGTVLNFSMKSNDTDPNGNTLVYEPNPVVLPKHGNVIIHPNGTFDYTPEANYVGFDSFTYRVCDNGIPPLCSTAIVSLELTKTVPVNHAPNAVNDINNTLANTAVSGNVLTNDSDPDGNELLVNTKLTVIPMNGSVVINSDGNYIYTPNAGYVGEDNFVYSVCEKNTSPVLCSEAAVTIEVRTLITGNKAPIANEDESQVLDGKTVVINVLANDFDPDSNPIHISRILLPVKHGALVQNVNGTFSYTPEVGFTGLDQFVYEICDDQVPSLCARATVTIRVFAPEQVNHPPFAADDAYFTSGTKISGNLALNDNDPDGNKLVYETIPVIPPAKGTVVISSNGLFEYTPNGNFAKGTDQFVYQVCDDGKPSACSKATVYITLIRKETPVIIDRLATNDVNITFKNTPVSGNVLINDAGFYGFNSTVSLYSIPAKGTVVLAPNGEYTYTPKKDVLGTDNFYYTVCTAEDRADCDTVNVTILILDDNLALIGPVANDDELQTPVNTAVTGNVLLNDLSPSGDLLILNPKSKDGPKHGTLVLRTDGTFTYTPETGFTGQDYFIYEICGNVSGLCATASVTITVSSDLVEVRLFAADDFYFSYGEAVQGNLIANDLYPSAGTLSVNRNPVVQPANGLVTINPSGTFIYTPKAGFMGTDQFVYEICDTKLGDCDMATVYVMVKEKPALYADLSILKSGPAIAVPGDLVNYKLTVTNLGTATASNVQINDYLPVAIENPKFNLEGSQTLNNWSGYYLLTLLEVNKPFTIFIKGTVSANSSDTLINLATVTSSTWDPSLANNISVVKTIIRRGPVARIQGAPYIAVGSCNVQGKSLDGSKSAGDGLSFSWSPSVYLDNASSSKPVFHPGISTRYKLTVTDSKGLKDTASVMVSVMPAPKAVTDKNVFVDVPNASILLNGAKSTGVGLSYLWLSKEGIIMNGETKPTALVSGLGMYYLQVTDSLGCLNRDSVNVGLYIQAINDTASTKINESVIINVVRNDIPQNAINPSSISIVTPPLHGIASVAADSLILYMPEQSYIGQDEFVYAICDYFRNCDNAHVLVLINDLPFFIPEAFSPNGDGVNDKFEIQGLAKYQTVEIEIFNRWGNIVYQSKNYGEGKGKSGFWDGTATSGLRVGSGPVPSGTYYYILTLGGKEKISKSVYLDR